MARLVAAAALLAVLLSVAACGRAMGPGSASPPTVTDNLTGSIDRAVTPACPTGEPCDPPAVATFIVFSQPSKQDVRVRVSGDGSFSANLGPGFYTISAAPPPMTGHLEPSSVRIPASGRVTLQLRIVT